ncbi:MAG: methionine synthase [Acidobacteriota bacterium]|nr:MAG: methionine synthase [Acidobacteriota bacterium]
MRHGVFVWEICPLNTRKIAKRKSSYFFMFRVFRGNVNMEFLDLLKEKIIVFDGAMGSNLQSLELTLDDWGGANFENCSENLLYTRPDAIRTVHKSFLDVGCDVIETNSFGGSEVVLTEFGIADKTYDVNKKAAELAKELARDYSTYDKPRFVAGSIGPGTKLPTLGHISYRDLKEAYREQVRGLIDGGADIMMVETCQDLLQTKAALAAIFEHFEKHKMKLPVIASVTIEVFGTMLNGTEIGAALTALEPFPIDVIGMNCGTGPKHMADSFRYLCENSPIPVSVLPNAGLPEVKDGKQHYDETPESFAAQVEHFANDLGANVVGGCCGTSPEHLRLVVERLSGVSPKDRDAKLQPSASSIYFQQPYTQDASFLIVGERVNASGSKKMRDLLDAEDWDGLVNLAKSQEKEGAHILDVNVDFVGRDGVADMHELASRLVTNVKIPIMFDSTEWEKMEAGLEHAGGKSILNSTNYEDGEPRFLKVLDLAKEYGAAVVIGLIDEEGMARAYDDKIRIARRAYKQVTEYGIPGHDIFFDPLALPISTGIEEDRKNADETIRAIRDIHAEMPDANIILGVSNISFGLSPAARVVLNSVFLHDCVEAGMNSAIVNASKILPLMRFSEHEIDTARDLIYDRRKFDGDVCVYDPLTEFTKLFEGKTAASIKPDITNLPVEERLKEHIIEGEKIGLEDSLKEALEKYPPLDIINSILLDGMKVVGDLFGAGQMQLPFVLQSAEAMKSAVKFLEPFMEKVEGSNKGVMVLATVKGDVHDIGKNLVDIILTNNGYKVVNLGIKQNIDDILRAAEEHNCDAIGMSGLLVKSTLIMRDNLEIMNERGIKTPVILGGAALNRRYVDNDLIPLFNGKLFYARDAFDGLHAMDELTANGTVAENADALTHSTEGSAQTAEGSTQITKGFAQTAEGFAQTAEGSAQTAEGSAQTAEGSAQTAEGFAQTAEGSAQTAEGFAQTAEGSAQTAEGSAQTAEGSAQTAEGSAQTAEGLAQTAEGSAQIIEGSLPNVEDLVGEDAKLGVEAARISSRSSGDTSHTTRSDVAELSEVPKAPFYGTKVVAITDLTKVFDFINETALFKGQWQYKQGKSSAEEYEELRRSTILPKYEEIKTKAIREKLLEAKLVYGYFPCNSDGNDLIIWDDDLKTERMRFNFPRQPIEQRGGKNLCLADFFAPVGGVTDVVAFQLVTMGRRASEHSAELFKADNYQDYLLFHGLSVESAEALAEMWHKRVREELGIADADAPEMAKLFHQGYQGSRFSFGYPACPRIEDQTKLFELLKPERIGVELTDEFMLEPEQSTSAIIIHHPEAKYFNIE